MMNPVTAKARRARRADAKRIALFLSSRSFAIPFASFVVAVFPLIPRTPHPNPPPVYRRRGERRRRNREGAKSAKDRREEVRWFFFALLRVSLRVLRGCCSRPSLRPSPPRTWGRGKAPGAPTPALPRSTRGGGEGGGLTLAWVEAKVCAVRRTVAVAQLVERQVVVLDVAGSSPVGHPFW